MATPNLLLLHGLGANAAVWTELLDAVDWPGQVLAPDLAGHGSAEWTGDYTVQGLADHVVRQIGAQVGAQGVIVVGHSLGGAVGIELASGSDGLVVRGAAALGVKVSWSDADVEGMARVAAKGVRWFDTAAEAGERFLRNAGLAGVVGPDHPAVAAGIVEGDEGWRVSQDPATFAQTALDMAGLMAAAQCPVILGAGAEDAMAPEAHLAEYDDDPRIAPGAGHNVQVTCPAWVIGLIEDLRSEIDA